MLEFLQGWMLNPFSLSLAIFGGYLSGSIPFGLLITKWAGLGDIRAIGSGNIGATNVLRTGRKDLALLTFLLDGGKAALAFLAMNYWAGPNAGFIAGACAFIGHCFPIWLRFRGGKGVASFFGLLGASMPVVMVVAALTWLSVAFVWRYSSLGGILAAIVTVLATFLTKQPPLGIAMISLVCVLILWRHRPNIIRLMHGTEPRIGDKKPATESEAS